jgi:hypothetical protein
VRRPPADTVWGVFVQVSEDAIFECIPGGDLDAQSRDRRAAGNVRPPGKRLRETRDVGRFHLASIHGST